MKPPKTKRFPEEYYKPPSVETLKQGKGALPLNGKKREIAYKSVETLAEKHLDHGAHHNEVVAFVSACNSINIPMEMCFDFIVDSDRVATDSSKADPDALRKTVSDIYERYVNGTNVSEPLQEIRENETPATLNEMRRFLDENKVLVSDKIRFTKPGLTINDKVIINVQEYLVLLALPGAGKTNVCEAIVASFIAQKNKIEIDSLGLTLHPREGKLLYIDTERPDDDNTRSKNRIIRRLGDDNKRKFVHSDNFIDVDYYKFSESPSSTFSTAVLEYTMSNANYDYVILDGSLEFTDSLSNEESAKAFANKVRVWAKKFDTTFIITLHPNKNTDIAAGHLGAFFYRYCRAMLLIRTNQSDQNVKEITPHFSMGKLAHAGVSNFSPIYMTWDTNKSMFVSADQPEAKSVHYDINALKKIFNGLAANGQLEPPSTQIKKMYMDAKGLSIKTVGKYINEAICDGVIIAEGKTSKQVLSMNENY